MRLSRILTTRFPRRRGLLPIDVVGLALRPPRHVTPATGSRRGAENSHITESVPRFPDGPGGFLISTDVSGKTLLHRGYTSFHLPKVQVILFLGILSGQDVYGRIMYKRKWRVGKSIHNAGKKEGRMAQFRNRRDAGRILAQELSAYADRSDVIVLAVPRGGLPVAYEVAMALSAPLDIFIVRKLGLPGHQELAMGAIASGGIRILNEDIIRALNIPGEMINNVAQQEMQELQRREHSYRGNRPAPEVRDRTVFLIDDGLATGASMRAAVAGLRARRPARIVIAVPTAAPQTCDSFKTEVDEIVCAITPEPFYGVGKWYEDFSQVTDEEVRAFLEEATRQLLR